jgi:nitroreductase
MEQQPANETLMTISRRRSVRQFLDRPIAEEAILAILDAANKAPSAHNQQSWRFTVLRGPMKAGLARLVSAKGSDFPKPASSILRMAARSIAGAPVVVAVMNTGDLIEHGTRLFRIESGHSREFFRTMEIQSSAAAVENMLLAAESLGLGTVWLGILYLIRDEVLQFLDESRGEFMAVVPVGYPVREQSGPAKKRIEEMVRFLD